MDTIRAQPTQSNIPSVPRDWRRTALQIAAGLAAVMREMSFVGHLEELRRRLIWSVVFVGAAFAVCWFAASDLLDSVFACVIAAAVLTPTTDPGNRLVLAGPMIVLYCVGIVVAWIFGRPRTALSE